MLITLSPVNAKADEWDKKTIVTFSQPVEIPGRVLPAGTYVFRSIDPHVIEISNKDETQVDAMLLTASVETMEPADKTVITFEEGPKGTPQALKTWFYPGDTTGEEFLYTSSNSKKDEIAALRSQIAEMRNTEAKQAQDISAMQRQLQDELKSANRATLDAQTADDIAASADRVAGDADQRAEAAQGNAQRSLSQIDTVAENIENRIGSLDKYKTADEITVTFNFNSDALNREDMNQLDKLASTLCKANTGYLVELKGFTDNIGTEKYNLGLSDRRVESVLRYLVNRDVPLYRISLVGLGKEEPVANNRTAGGREQNRRVEVRVLRSLDTVASASQ
jgi:outer membrane protein OmpA-like peptidoglycan-associated protein